MNYRLLLAFLLVLITAVVLVANTPKREEVEGGRVGFEKGINVAFFRKIETADLPALEATLDRLKNNGVTHLSIVFFIYQDDVHSSEIYEEEYLTLPKQQLVSYLRLAKKKGFVLQLRPLLGLKEQTSTSVGRSNIVPENLKEWFSSYKQQILKYANLASEEDVAVFGIGSEMSPLSGYSEEWQKLINDVRDVYKGKILYAANWDDFTQGSFKHGIDWLGSVDIIGVDAYFPLKVGDSPEVEDLVRAWGEWNRLFDRLGESNKKFIISEIGVSSTREHFDVPWRFDVQNEPVDQESQAKYYEAAFRFLQSRVGGIYWWVVNDGMIPEDPRTDKSFSPLGKKAEEVISDWY